jgi:DivIVA domain-containing protein
MSEQSTSTFRTVMRGYDPAEVDRLVSELSRVAAESQARADELANRVDTLAQQAASAD